MVANGPSATPQNRWCIGAIVLGTPAERASLVEVLTTALEADQTVRPSNRCHPDEFDLTGSVCIAADEKASVVRWIFNIDPEPAMSSPATWCVPASPKDKISSKSTWYTARIRHWLAELALQRPAGMAALFAVGGDAMQRSPSIMWIDSAQWEDQASRLESHMSNQRLQETYKRSGACIAQTARPWREILTDGAFISTAVWPAIQNNLADTSMEAWVALQRRQQHLENALPSSSTARATPRF